MAAGYKSGKHLEIHMTKNAKLLAWVAEIKALCTPDEVVWCDGSLEEYQRLLDEMVDKGAAIRLNQALRPGCYLFRSDPSDVARVENRTFIASQKKEDAGPTNNWADPALLKETLLKLFRGCMKGRRMYVLSFVMGPIGSPFSLIGVEITDSPYVVVSMRLMTRMGEAALNALGEGDFVPCLHSVGAPLEKGQEDVPWPCAKMEQKYIAHFPEDRAIWSYGSGYGGNALLGKKCLALRIASVIAREEGWQAEHMLILSLKNPEGEKIYLSAAFPSACGKTNLAMLVPTLPGFQVQTLGDDIAWLRKGPDGSLRALNPETGFFGVAPGTSFASNPNAMKSILRDTLFTNVALTDEGDVWWQGMDGPKPGHLIDWQGKEWTPEKRTPAAHPNARFTVAACQCPSISPEWEDLEGVPLSAILLGGRRAGVIPLVHECFDWQHGVFMGSMMGSEITAAVISNAIGQVRRDPFAMLPFIGYHVGDYLWHWLETGKRFEPGKLPRIYCVNWFLKDGDGRFLWPGFGENVRVLKWVFQRVMGRGKVVETPIGLMPPADAIDRQGLPDVDDARMNRLLSVDICAWLREVQGIRASYAGMGNRLPQALLKELDALEARLEAAREG
jgi:phosphoenolpyruvate carboxykinase (GTP)